MAVRAFYFLLKAKVMAEDYGQHDNIYRPHSSLGYRTPSDFTVDWKNTNAGLAESLAH